MKYTTKNKFKKFFTVTGIIIGCSVLAFGGGSAALMYIKNKNRTQTISELTLENVAGDVVYNKKHFNIAVLNPSSKAKHTVISIADLGIQDFNLYAKHLTGDIAKNNRIVLMDRLGSGLSDDTFEERTVDNIVTEYRDVLKQLNIEGPYILLAHNIGGLYATYWESLFPDEIEGVIYVDPMDVNETRIENTEITLKDNLYAVLSTVGVSDVFYEKIYGRESLHINANDASIAETLSRYNSYSFARLSEKKNLNNNLKTVYDSIVTNDIPKMYISASHSFEKESEVAEYLDYINVINASKGLPAGPKSTDFNFSQYAEEKISDSQKYLDKNIYPYMEKLGNCHLVKLPGDQLIYEQLMTDVRAAVTGFVDYLDGKTDKIYDRYYDKITQKWKEYAALAKLEESEKQQTEENGD